jgi:hypothetical protein
MRRKKMRTQKFEISLAEMAALKALKCGVPSTVSKAYLSLEARYGDNQPKLGVVFQTPIKRSKGKLVIDTYGHGDVHNVSTPTEFSKRKSNNWNQPHPFPADVSVIHDTFHRGTYNKRWNIVLGRNSDPFMWMDNKYKITLATLEMLLSWQFKIDSLEVHTRSDLIAHDDYIAWLRLFHQLTVYIHVPRGSAELARINEPGAPSAKRRFSAARKLREAGIKVVIVREGSVKTKPVLKRSA